MKGAAVSLRPARATDVDALLAIEDEAFTTDRISRRALRHSLRAGTITVVAAVAGGKPVGYALAHYRRGATVARLASIAVCRAAAGRGVGRLLLSAVERDARRRGAARLRLEVRPNNAAARALYESAGYCCIGVVDNYYEDGAQTWRYEKALRRVSGSRGAARGSG